jgi:RND family efflux transporter MFP subunit
LRAARQQLSRTTLKAPLGGTVVQRNVNPGEVVVPGVHATVEGKPLLVVADLGSLLVKADLNQMDVARVTLGQVAEVKLDALPEVRLSGRVTKVAAASTRDATGADVFPIEITLDPPPGRPPIRPGMTAEIELVVDRVAQALVVPVEAVTSAPGSGRATVVVVHPGGRRERRTVEVGRRNDHHTEIRAGLVEGDVVAIDPASPPGPPAR